MQRKRARIADKKKRIAKAKSEAADYQKLLASRLKEQREKIGKIFSGESDGKAKIVLSGPSNSWVRFDFEFVIMGHNIAYSEQKRIRVYRLD